MNQDKSNTLITPNSNIVYRFYYKRILEQNAQWIMFGTSPANGRNVQGTHVYQDSTRLPVGKMQIKCDITLPNGTIVNSDIITIPWYSVIPNQKKSNGSSFGGIKMKALN